MVEVDKIQAGKVSAVRLREYILTWLAICGTDYVGLGEAIQVDDALDDPHEYCWSYALHYKYLERIEKGNDGDTQVRLTEKGLKLLKRKQKGETP
jgi:hypothetical protein